MGFHLTISKWVNLSCDIHFDNYYCKQFAACNELRLFTIEIIRPLRRPLSSKKIEFIFIELWKMGKKLRNCVAGRLVNPAEALMVSATAAYF